MMTRDEKRKILDRLQTAYENLSGASFITIALDDTILCTKLDQALELIQNTVEELNKRITKIA